MIPLRDAIHDWHYCGVESFYQADGHEESASVGICWKCNKRLKLPFHIRLGKHKVMPNHDTQLFSAPCGRPRPLFFLAAP